MKIPNHLAGGQATGAHENESVAQYEIGNYKNFVYLILDWSTKKAAIVDPQYDLSSPLEDLKRHGFELCAIFLTHTHPDHTAGVPELVKLYPHLPIFLHRDDLHRLDSSIIDHGNIKLLRDEDWTAIGGLHIQALHTPGHSAGEFCFLLPEAPAEIPGTQRSVPYLFTGDTIFIQDCGRTDMKTGSNEEMFQSIQRIKKLSPECIVLPGHHYRLECASLLENEIRQSPPFQCKSVAELAALP